MTMPFSAPNALNITSAEITPAPPAPTSTSNVSAATRVEVITFSIGSTRR